MREIPPSFHQPKTQPEHGSLQARERDLTTQGMCRHLDLGRPSFQNCEKQMSVVAAAQSVVFCCNGLSWLRAANGRGEVGGTERKGC